MSVLLAIADFLGGEQKPARQKGKCLTGMGRVWRQNACITHFSRLTLKFTNTMRLQLMLSLKKSEKNMIASHTFHQDARLQCERQFTPTLRPSHGFLGMWSLPFCEKPKVRATCITFLLSSPW